MKHNLIDRIKGKCGRILDYIKDEFIYFCLDYDKEDGEKTPFRRSLLRCFIGHRQIVGFYGECHIYVYGSLLKKSKEFKKRYVALGTKEIEYLAKYHKKINKRSLWDKLDVLIYNPGIPTRPGAPDLSEVLEWTSFGTKKIEVTNATFVGYVPQHTSKVYENGGYFVWGDKNLNRILVANENVDESLRELERDDYYSQETVMDYFAKSLKKLSVYEKKCTVKIADYIEKYGGDRILYYSVTHPETEIMVELTRRIAELLEVHDIGDSDYKDSLQYNLHSHGEVVYPSVCKALGISEAIAKTRKIKPGDYEVEYNFFEYIKEYIHRASANKEI